VYVVCFCTAILEPRTVASVSQAAGGSCIISHLQQSVTTQFHGRHSALRKPQCVLLMFRISSNISTFLKKKETTSPQSNPPPHHPSWRLLQTETITGREYEGETRYCEHIMRSGVLVNSSSPLTEPGRQNSSTQRGTCPSVNVSTTSVTRTGPGSNPCLLGAVSSCHLSGNTL
jgi:hypothetical protein